MTSLFEPPLITEGLPGTGGRLRESFGDFVVEELPVFEPLGEGQHIFVNLTREGLTTRELARKLASLFGLGMVDIGYAGLKDKYARSTQTFSILIANHVQDSIEDTVKRIDDQLPVVVNWARLHNRKLRPGQLLGNRFTITITGLELSQNKALDRALAIADRLRDMGLANYYGPQRVSVDGKNLLRGFEIIKGRRRVEERWLRRYLVTSFLSHVCNRYLARRVESGGFLRLLQGDIAKKYATGGMFVVEDLDAEQTRYEAKEISFTAPVFGPRMWTAKGPSGELEKEVLTGAGITLEELGRLGVRGSRRLGRLIPDLDIALVDRGLRIEFSLPKGAYATTVLREIMKP